MLFSEKLKEFLTANGCQDPERAIAPLEKLFQMAEAGKYSLSVLEEINKAPLMVAVSSAVNLPVSKVVMISSERPIFESDSNVYQIGDIIGFTDILVVRVGNNLKNLLGEERANNLMGFLLENFQNGLGLKLRDSLVADGIDVNVINFLGPNLGCSMMFYLGYCLLNDQEQIAKLGSLVEFWSQCLIIGFKQDEPETLLVICK